MLIDSVESVVERVDYSPTSIKRPPSGLKSGRLIKVGRLTEVQYTLDKKGSKHDFMASI